MLGKKGPVKGGYVFLFLFPLDRPCGTPYVWKTSDARDSYHGAKLEQFPDSHEAGP